MPRFSEKSLSKLSTCCDALVDVCMKVIEVYNFSVICGHRTIETQFELYRKGRELVGGVWRQTGNVITNCDGIRKKSKHNYYPSQAVDLAPYPIDWNDIERFHRLAGHMMQAAYELGVKLEWGGEWTNFKDYPHYQT